MTPTLLDLREGAAVPPLPQGAKRAFSVVIAGHPDGTPAAFPLIAIAGRQPGPTAVFVGGIHGDEYEGPAALWQLAENLDPAALAGRVLIVPIANCAAFGVGTRTSPVDGVNLARIFPGDPSGTLSYRLADALMRHVVDGADLLVDSHSGGTRLAFAPVAGFYSADADAGISADAAAGSLALARAMGLPSLWRLPPVAGVLSCEAAKRGIAVTGCEIGGRGGCLPGDVALYLDGYRSVLRHAGLLAGGPALRAHTTYLEGDWVRSDRAGYLQTHVELGSRVRKGSHLATLHDSFGGVLEEFLAARDGFVMATRHLRTLGVGDLATCVVEERPLGPARSGRE